MKLVLLHAFPLDERMWEPQREALAGLDVVVPRLYGRGPRMDDWADEVLAEVDGELVAVGASMGGYCALALARRAPGRVRAVVLVGSRPDADSEERRAGRAETIALIRNEGAEGLWRAMRPRLFPPEAPPEVVDRARRLTLDQNPDELVDAVAAIRDRPDASDVARDLGEALFVVVGTRDPFVGADEGRTFGRGARVEVVDGAGHLLSMERPEQFNQLLSEFVGRWT